VAAAASRGIAAEQGRATRARSRAREPRSKGQRDRRPELEAQRRALAAACRRRGWQLLESVEETGHSAKDRKPPGLEAALRVLGADGQALLAAKRMRPARALLGLAALLASAQKQGWALLALDCALEPIVSDV